MGCFGRICLLIFVVSTGVLTITSLGFTGYYTKPHCTGGCQDDMEEGCPGAYALISGDNYYKCPWKSATYVTGLIGLSLVVILLAMIVFAIKGTALRRPIILVGLLALILSLVSTALMVKDLVKGIQYYKDNVVIAGAAFYPVEYVVNIILMVFTILSTMIVLCGGSALSNKNRVPVQKFDSPA